MMIKMTKSEKYTPNHIPKAERVFNVFWSFILLAIAYLSFTSDSFHLPGRGASGGIIFTGLSLWIFGSALVFGLLNLLVNVVDHYDKRNNETQYKMLSRILTSIAVILVIWATSLAYGDAQPKAVVV
jgi:hypothetical protein